MFWPVPPGDAPALIDSQLKFIRVEHPELSLHGRGQRLQLAQIVIAGRTSMWLSGMIEKVTGFVVREEVSDQRGHILKGIAGVREKIPVQELSLTLKNQFQAVFDNRARVGRKVGVASR